MDEHRLQARTADLDVLDFAAAGAHGRKQRREIARDVGHARAQQPRILAVGFRAGRRRRHRRVEAQRDDAVPADGLLDQLGELTRQGVSLLLTTHHLEEAEARCSRTVIIDHGRAIAAGTLPELVDQTVGRHRIVTLRVDAPVAVPPAGAETDREDPRLLRARVTDVARDLPALLSAVSASGREIQDVEVRGPSLQSVFIHLTGRELRE